MPSRFESPIESTDPSCWRCGSPAYAIVESRQLGTRAFCCEHFMRLIDVLPGSMVRFAHGSAAHARRQLAAS